MNELLRQEPAELEELSGPMRLIQTAIERGATVEQIAKLMELQERMEANAAKKAFFAAMAKFKDNAPAVLKNKHVRFENNRGGVTEYDHATLDHAVEVLGPALSAVGIRHRWKTQQEGTTTTIICVLSHELGHAEETSLTFAGHDNSGGKNPIQAMISAVSYLERKTFLMATGMAPKGMVDDDGAKSGAPVPELAREEFAASMDAIEGAANIADLQRAYFAAYKRAEKIDDKLAMASFEGAKNKRKAELA